MQTLLQPCRTALEHHSARTHPDGHQPLQARGRRAAPRAGVRRRLRRRLRPVPRRRAAPLLGRPSVPARRRRRAPPLGAQLVRPAGPALGALAAAPHWSQHRALRCWLAAAGLEDEAELLQPLFWEFVVKMFREAVLGCSPELATGVRAGGDGAGGQEVGDRGTRRCASGSGSIRASSQAT